MKRTLPVPESSIGALSEAFGIASLEVNTFKVNTE